MKKVSASNTDPDLVHLQRKDFLTLLSPQISAAVKFHTKAFIEQLWLL